MVCRNSRSLALAVALAGCSACAARQRPDVKSPAASLRTRTGADARLDGVPTASAPPGVQVDDGLTADEAVALALWNNAAFQVSVTDLGFARADLVEAGVFTNPVLSLLLPIGPKQLEATLRWPIEVLWERPRRMAAARLALDVASERLVQAGLDLVVAVRTAYVDATLAGDRERLARDTAALLARIDSAHAVAAGGRRHLRARSRTAHVDAARAALDVDRARTDAAIAAARLMLLVGRPADQPALTLVPSTGRCRRAPRCPTWSARLWPPVRTSARRRSASRRPAARLGWERSRILALTAVLDANGSGSQGFETGPGIDLGLPVLQPQPGRPGTSPGAAAPGGGRLRGDAAARRPRDTGGCGALRSGADVASRRGGTTIVGAARGQRGGRGALVPGG